MSFLCFRIPSRMPHYNQSRCLLRLLLAVAISHIFFVLMTRTVLRSTDQIFCKMLLNRIFVRYFLMIGLELWAFGRKTTEVKCHFIMWYEGFVLSTWLTLLLLPLIAWLGYCLQAFTLKSCLFTLPHCTFGWKSLWSIHTYRAGSYAPFSRWCSYTN